MGGLNEGAKPWQVGRLPDGYWRDPSNRTAYMDWLAGALGIAEASGWYNVTQRVFQKYHGQRLLESQYGNSLLAALREYRPHEDWIPWRFKRLPDGFWSVRSNRVEYMDWLGKRLGYSVESDWYSITQRDFYNNNGRGLLASAYDFSPQAALRDYRPEYNWLPWLFNRVPQGFWHQRENRVDYLRWLGEVLGFSERKEWNEVRQKDFIANGGGGLLMNVYGGSPHRAVKEFFEIN